MTERPRPKAAPAGGTRGERPRIAFVRLERSLLARNLMGPQTDKARIAALLRLDTNDLDALGKWLEFATVSHGARAGAGHHVAARSPSACARDPAPWLRSSMNSRVLRRHRMAENGGQWHTGAKAGGSNAARRQAGMARAVAASGRRSCATVP